MNDELKTIKKIYGEEMMHLCRELFPSLLENEGLLLSILEMNLAPNHVFANDIKENNLYEEFKDWVYSFIDVEDNNQIITNKTPFELMNEAGYSLYECKSEEDIQSFKKYYAPNEVLCTINNGGRLNRCYVFFAVKKNVDEIKREYFAIPQRQDEYGTSVISIQFSRGKLSTLSIKNRYNHTVNNPDATFSNNLENIIPGLTKSFEKYLNLKINQYEKEQEFFLTDALSYVKANDRKYYRYKLEKDGVFYCENNIIIKDGSVITEYANNPERYILMEHYIVDLKEKKIIIPFKSNNNDDSFIKSINEVGNIKKINVLKNKESKTKIIIIYYEGNEQVKLEIDKENAIIGYENIYVDKIGHNFLRSNKQLSSISLPQVQTIGYSFLQNNEQLRSISLPQVQMIGDCFLFYNKQLINISLPQVQTIGHNFLRCNEQLSSISLPEVQTIGHNFLRYNQQLSSISLPEVQIIGDNFIDNNEQLSSISLPEVQTIGYNFLRYNEQLSSISLPEVQIIGDNFMDNNEQLSSISLPEVQIIGDNFMDNNEQLSSISLPQVQMIGDCFLFYNKQLINISLPQVQTIGHNFLRCNEQLSSISLPQVQTIGDYFLGNNYLINKGEIIKEMEKRNAQINNSKSR